MANIVLQVDNEPAVRDLARRAKQARAKPMEVRSSPRYSHASNGAVERSHQSLQGQIRTLRYDLERRYADLQAVSSTITPWLVRRAAWTLNRYQPHGKTKATSYELIKQHRYSSQVAPFGESILWKPPNPVHGGHLHKFDARFQLGIWVGRSELTDEHRARSPGRAPLPHRATPAAGRAGGRPGLRADQGVAVGRQSRGGAREHS